MDENNLDPKKIIVRNILILFTALIVSCAIIYYFTAPLYKELKIAELEVEIKNENINLKRSILSEIKKTGIKKDEKDGSIVEKLDNLISYGNNYEDYIAHISHIAKSKNLIINKFSIGKADEDYNKNIPKKKNGKEKIKEPDLNKVKIDFSIYGGFINFVSFLRTIENSIPFAQIETISVSSDEQTEDETQGKNNKKVVDQKNDILNYDVSLLFYY